MYYEMSKQNTFGYSEILMDFIINWNSSCKIKESAKWILCHCNILLEIDSATKKKCDLFQSTDKAYSSAIGCYVDSAPMTPADTNLYTIKRHRAIVTQNKNKLSLSQCSVLNLCDVLGKNGLWAVHKIARTKCIQFYELHFGFFFRVYFLFEIDFFFSFAFHPIWIFTNKSHKKEITTTKSLPKQLTF